jgi:hypothetical protein
VIYYSGLRGNTQALIGSGSRQPIKWTRIGIYGQGG